MRAASRRTVAFGESVPGGTEVQELRQAFRRNADGSWTCVQAAELDGPNGRIQVSEGTVYRRGTKFMGVELAKWLDERLGAG